VVGTDGDAKTLIAGTKYYWCVNAYDGKNWSGWSSAWSFTTATANSPPTAGFTYSPSNPTTSDTISFTDTSTDSDGTISSWSWDFGDTTTSTLQNPTHQYTTAATYTVTLTVTDNDGATGSASQNIPVTATSNSPPTANFTYSPTSPTTDATVSFTDTSTDTDGTISSWSWDFGDGSSSTLQNTTHQYTSANTYTVTLTVTDNDAATDSTSKSITVTWGTVGSSGLVYVLVDSSIYTSIQSNLTTYKSDLENEGYSVGIYSDSWATIGEVRTILQNNFSYGLVGAVLVGNLPIAWYYLVNPASWGVDSETFPTELYYMDLNGTWSPGSGTQTNPFTNHTGNVAPEIWVGRLYASTAGGTEVTLLKNYFYKNHLYRTGGLSLPQRALVYVDDDWYSWADQWSNDVGLLYTNRTLVKDKETTIAGDYKNRLTSEYEWISLFSHSDSWYHAMKYNSGASWSYVYNTDITTIDPRASFYNLYCCYAANYSDGADNGYLGGRYVFSNTYGLMAVGSTKTGSMLNFDDFYNPLGNGKTIGNAFKDWYILNGETGQGADSRAWFYGMTILGDPTLKPNSTTTDTTPPTGSISINSGETYTTTTSVTLTLSATDAETGVSEMCFSNDGTTYTAWETYATSKAWTLTTGDGTKTVYIKYKNGAGLVSSAYSDSIILDTTTPTGSIVINSGDTYTTSTSVTLTLSASDATSGVYQMCFSNDNTTYTAWEAYGTSKAWTLTTGDGTKTVYVKYKNGAGLVSSAYSDTIILDTVDPTSSVSALPEFETTTSFTVSWSGSDATSGIASYDIYYKDGSAGTWTNWLIATTLTSSTFTGTDGHTYYFLSGATDNAGNAEVLAGGDGDTSTTIDATAPTGSISINSGDAYTTSTSVTLTLSASDTTSGVAQMCFSNDGTTYTAWEAYATSKSWTLTTGDSIKTVYVKYKDNASLISSAYSDTIILDTAAPTGSISINSAATYTTSISVTLSLTYNDATSGVAQVRYSNDGAWDTELWESPSATKSWTLTTGDGTKTVYYQIKDNASLLSSTYSDTIILDTTAPSIASTTPSDGAVNVSLTQNIIIQFSEEMDTSSVQYTCSPNPGGWISSWNAAKDTLTLTHNDFSPGVTYTFNVTAAKDLAGHDLVSGSVPNPWTFTTAKIIKFNFSPGWNLLTLPFINSTIDNAESLANAIGENCTAISCWNNSLGRFITHPVGTEISNFSIEPGVGYMVFVSDKTVFTFTGETKIDNVTMSLGVGWNPVGRFNETTSNAESIGSSIDNCTHVATWNVTSQSFDVYAVGSGVNNFNIEQGDGYLVYVTKESQWVNC
ncbi:MAG: PKD domain-containing protein, partial [Candidatus Thermoplasmatota archaeon]|nr:PKD domain-containing protein [Candidatus Thermoplasmatota archaeon]